MKIRFGILILFLVAPITAYGHSEFFFPRLFTPAELPNTGFALLNPDNFTATVTLYMISAAGSQVSPLATLRIGAGGQLSKKGSELFPNATGSGWVYVVTDAEGMQAFWVIYDAGITFLDGAEAVQLDTFGPDQIIPFVAGQTELSVINPNGIDVPVTIRLFGNDGELATAFNRQIPKAGGYQTDVSSMFPSADMTRARYIRIRTTSAPIASVAQVRGFLVPNESAIINGMNVAPSRAELNFPHVINGGLTGTNYTTVIGVTNVSPSSQTVTITFNPDAGGAISVTRTISGSGALRETAQSLFNLAPEFQSGWVRVNGMAAITGFAAYADSIAGGFAVVPAGASQTNLFFSHIADGPPQWQTGLALLNVSDTPANVEVYAVDPIGKLIGSARLTLDPGRKIAKVIHELIPETRGVNGGFVFVRTTNNVPLYGMELFYTEDLKVLSNVAAAKLVPGVIYTPPSQ
ncbi:MAG TPA: hypothetical protein VE422_45170 [Terriglobia bacterium]|nr:hypothetical protein [Terriglobia bacterium]